MKGGGKNPLKQIMLLLYPFWSRGRQRRWLVFFFFYVNVAQVGSYYPAAYLQISEND